MQHKLAGGQMVVNDNNNNCLFSDFAIANKFSVLVLGNWYQFRIAMQCNKFFRAVLPIYRTTAVR